LSFLGVQVVFDYNFFLFIENRLFGSIPRFQRFRCFFSMVWSKRHVQSTFTSPLYMYYYFD